MSMVVISDRVMCCTSCGFNFLSYMSNQWGQHIVRHLDGEMYTAHLTNSPCPNIGKAYRFPKQKPVEGIEVV